MPSYFVDTNCLVGITFFHDRWYRDVKPLYENNRLITSEAVLYEYCNRGSGDPPMPEDPSEADIQIESEEGKYRVIRNELKRKLPRFHTQIESLHPEELTLEKVIETIFDHFEIRDEAKPEVREFVEDYFENRALIPLQVNRGVQKLIDRILHTSEHNKQVLLDQATIEASRYHRMEKERKDIEYNTSGWIHEEDFCILLDAVWLAKRGEVGQLVTGDRGYLHVQEYTVDRYGLSLTWAGNEFYTDDLVYHEKENDAALHGALPQNQEVKDE